jgi:hypothetical protein
MQLTGCSARGCGPLQIRHRQETPRVDEALALMNITGGRGWTGMLANDCEHNSVTELKRLLNSNSSSSYAPNHS